jgi:hypothetical protein
VRVHSRPGKTFISLRDAEAEFGIPYARLYLWVQRQSKIPRLDEAVTGQSILIKRADLEAFIASNMTAVR